jgi:transposase InsO family protein
MQWPVLSSRRLAIQMDVKFLTLNGKSAKKIRRFQYAAIDDATRIRALKVYGRHTQANAIDFVDHVIGTFPFRIKEIRTDNGHEFQAKFHWHVEDKGIRHAYIKPSSPQLNGKVERSHRSDEQEFYQLLSYKGDVDLEAKLAEWERFYNLARPPGAHNGMTLTRRSEKSYNWSMPCLARSFRLHIVQPYIYLQSCDHGTPLFMAAIFFS